MAASRSGLGIVRERAMVHCAPFACLPHNSYHGGLQGRPVRSSTYYGSPHLVLASAAGLPPVINPFRIELRDACVPIYTPSIERSTTVHFV